MRTAYLLHSLAILATGAKALVTSFTFYEGKSWWPRRHSHNQLTTVDGLANEDVVDAEGLIPGVLSKKTICVDRKKGINSVKVSEIADLGESLYCIEGYSKTDCDEEAIAFTYPWDSAERGQCLSSS